MRVPFFDLAPMHDELREDLDRLWARVSHPESFVGGETVERFESQWAEYNSRSCCVGTDSGTSAVELTLAALGVGAGDEVIVPGNTFTACAEAVTTVGAKPVFVDVDPSTLLMTSAGVGAAITPRTAAVIVVHLYGQPANVDAIGEVASVAGIAMIEDASHAHGATWQGRPAGSLSLAGCFSFHPGKNLGSFGDGGAVVTNDFDLARKIRLVRKRDRVRQLSGNSSIPGTNRRLDAFQAAILSVKLKRLDAWNAARTRAVNRYRMALAGCGVEFVATDPRACSSHHLAVVQTDHRDRLRQLLAVEGISAGVHYPVPCHRQPAFEAESTPRLPVTERAAQRILSLPMFPHLTDEQIDWVAGTIRRVLDGVPRVASANVAELRPLARMAEG